MFERVCVIGVGFMGGSFALALKERYPQCQIYGIDINLGAISKALELKTIDGGSTQIKDILRFDPQLVVIATPVGTFEEIAKALAQLDIKCVITDLGSVKGRIVYMMEEHLGGNFVGGHPIAGTEKSGVENSLKDLFKGKRCVITPTEKTSPQAKKMVKDLWQSLDALVEEMDPYLHDYIFGAVSHMPHAVAFALIDAIARLSKDGMDLFEYPGGGFKDFTRIASSDPIMWRDIFLENAQNIVKAIEVFQESLDTLRSLIVSGKAYEVTQYLSKAKELRDRIA